MTDTNQLPPLPPLQPGDAHMESLIDAAIQGHASTREAMRWLVRQRVPQPAQATQVEVTDEQIIDIAAQWSNKEFAEGAWRFCTDFARAILALHSSTAPDLSCKSVQARLATQWGYVRPAAVPMTDAHPMQPIVIAKDGRIRFKKNQIVDDLYELHRVHKLDLNEMARRNYSQEDRNQFAQLIGYSVGGWGTLSYATGVEKADAIAEALAAQTKRGTP